MLKLNLRASAMALMTFPILVASPTISNSFQSKTVVQNRVPSPNQKSKTIAFVAKVVARKDDCAKILAKYLHARKSPMTRYARELVRIADKYNLDWRLLPAISGVESQYGIMVPTGSYNPYGWNNGAAYFKNWVDAANKVASGIRYRYAPSGSVDPFRIGPRYAANPAWAARVAVYMKQINQI